MGLNAAKVAYVSNKKQPDPMEAGTYPARLVQVIDLGVQEQQPFKGEPKPPAHEIMTTYEFVDEFLKDDDGNDMEDKPRWLSENFVLHNLSSELAKSTKRYLAIDPDISMDGDWTSLTGRAAMVTVVANPGQGKNAGKVFNRIASTSTARAKEAAKFPELKNPAKVFDQSDVSTVDIFFTLPDWLREKIKTGLEWEGSKMAKAVENYKGETNEEAKEKHVAKKEAAKAEPEATEEGDDW